MKISFSDLVLVLTNLGGMVSLQTELARFCPELIERQLKSA